MERRVLNSEGFFVVGKRLPFAEQTNHILKGVGLTARDLDGQKTLDVGAGNRFLEATFGAAGFNGLVVSVDLDKRILKSLAINPTSTVRTNVDLFGLPFRDNTFDVVFNHGGPICGDFASAIEAVRVTKPGGEVSLMPVFQKAVAEIQYAKFKSGEEDFGADDNFNRKLHIYRHHRRVYKITFDSEDIPIPDTQDGRAFWHKVEEGYSHEKSNALYLQALDELMLQLRDAGYNVQAGMTSTYHEVFRSSTYLLKLKKVA